MRYGKIQRDAAGYSWIQLDTYGYSWIRRDTAGYSGSAAKWLDIDRYRDTAGYQGYSEIQADTGEIQAESTEIHARGGLGLGDGRGV